MFQMFFQWQKHSFCKTVSGVFEGAGCEMLFFFFEMLSAIACVSMLLFSTFSKMANAILRMRFLGEILNPRS